MDLYVIRHAWAFDRDDERWPDDDLRPLTEEGKERFAKVVKALAGRGLAPEVVGTSPLVRCRQTAELLVAGLKEKRAVVELAELRPGGDVAGLLRWTAKQAREHERIAWVGHAPDVDRLCAAMIGGPDALVNFAKGGVAAIEFDGAPALGTGKLRWLVTAKVLGC
ncbi:MAG: histidine phosphatase family protein [Planctomycetaceae bacterium]|nr:histidine phosphatase family protein [Planctomycetaceae bacterium]